MKNGETPKIFRVNKILYYIAKCKNPIYFYKNIIAKKSISFLKINFLFLVKILLLNRIIL